MDDAIDSFDQIAYCIHSFIQRKKKEENVYTHI